MKLVLYVVVGFIAVAALIVAGAEGMIDSPYAPLLGVLGAALVMTAFVGLGLQK